MLCSSCLLSSVLEFLNFTSLSINITKLYSRLLVITVLLYR